MPTEFDPNWEYWTPSEEMTEFYEHINKDVAIIQTIIEFDDGKICDGIRFGSGNPNRPYGRSVTRRKKIPDTLTRCVGCGDFFHRRANCQKFCSTACRHEVRGHYTRYYPTRTCDTCGRYYSPKHYQQRFCGRTCSPQSIKRLQPTTCARCGKVFQPLASRTRFCGLKCGLAGNGAKRTLPDRVCKREGCGNIFRPHRHSTFYCSRKCGTAKNGKPRKLVDRKCEMCPNVFRPLYEKARFCSKTCFDNWQRGKKK